MSKYNVRRKAQLGLDIREGGIAIPIAPNMYYMNGRSHDDGGIAIGPNNKNGLEVEGGEVVKVGDKDIKVFSSVPLLRGASPAQLVMGGANPDTVFKAQEEFKYRNRINDDGTRYEVGGEKIYTPSKSIQRQIQETGKITIGGAPTIGGLRTRAYMYGLKQAIKYPAKASNIIRNIGGAIKKSLINKSFSYKPDFIPMKTWKYATGTVLNQQVTGNKGSAWVRTGKLINDAINNEEKEMKAGGIYIKPSKRGTFTAAATKHGMGVQEFANKVLANKEDYSSAMVKKANFARNASRWKKEFGGEDDTKTAALKRLKAKRTIKGNYGGGMFGGAGAGSVIMTQPEFITDTITKRYLVPVTQNFNDAFGDAVDAGLDKFMFNKKWYTTEKGNNPNNNAAGTARTQTIYLPVEHKEVRRRKKEYGGSMIYTINGNVKNGLSIRPKAKYGIIDKKDKDVKVGQDGLIYKRAADGEWYTDGTVHAAFKKATPSGLIKPSLNSAKKFNYIAPEPKRVYIEHSDYEEEKETKKIGSLTYEKNESGKWVPSAKQSTITTRDGGRPKDFGMTRTGINHPNGSYKYHPLTGEKINEIDIVETSEPSVKSTTKISSKPNSTPRRGETKTSMSKAASKPSTKGADVKYGTPLKEKKESLYITGIKNNSVTPLRAGMEKIKSPSSTGGGTQSKDGRWIGQYKTTNVGDWIGLGSNLAGTIASYFMTKNAINKTPEPIKPVMAQAAKLKTRYNVEPQLNNIREVEQMNRAAVRRNTQSSNASLAREQRLMNEARGTRNTLYGQKENIETQLINQDRLNRQSVMRDNVRTYNEYLNRLTATKMAQNEMRASNINNLISGLTGSVSNILGTIESRRATNNTLRAIAAANPNVDARLIGGFDYYIDPITKRKYNKNQQYVGTING